MEIQLSKEIEGWYQLTLYQSTPAIRITAEKRKTRQEAISSLISSIEHQKKKMEEAINELKNF